MAGMVLRLDGEINTGLLQAALHWSALAQQVVRPSYDAGRQESGLQARRPTARSIRDVKSASSEAPSKGSDMRVTYYDEFTRLRRLKPPYAWALRLAVAGSLLMLVVKMVEAGFHG